uniref:Phospholipase D n=1 Tax=Musa acuminata subsp. malaccensis TaxID=214687 RepID=A0A804L2X7_MUSAM|nr:PREDICTED: phospholipase D delta-like isoform X4 [Musa acuminata subsp. malaccensis]
MGSTSDQAILLHGDLDLEIIAARDLLNMDLCAERFRRCFGLCGLPFPRPADGRNLPSSASAGRARPKIITSDPYTKVVVAGATVARTHVIPNTEDPVWRQRFRIPLAHCAAKIEFQVKDNDLFGSQLIGTATIPAALVASVGLSQEWLPIIAPTGRPPKPDSALLVSLSFTPVEANPLYRHGIAGDRKHLGVSDTYFHLRKGGKVTLYQDAHVRAGELPGIELEGGKVFQQGKCWEDICHAILEAHHLIYIVGWSLYDKVKLVREPTRLLPAAGKCTLGELLKYKSEEGVRVCVLVWDDKTSHDKYFFKSAGVMQTHDEEIRKFFKHSSVICVLSPRYASGKLSMVKQQVVGTLYTHHQKCLLVDTEASPSTRKITAFLGGLDLCDGRYDTPQHRLFQDLESVYDNDFHNPILSIQSKGPREPWHDLHCKIEGPAAYDVLKNFEQRWKKATQFHVFRKHLKNVTRWQDDALIKIDRISWILSPSPSHTNAHGDPNIWVTSEEDCENWHVQVFRSIDSGSVKGFPKSVDEAGSMNLVCSKNLVIDKSIHTAYVKAIRSARHFIYIENQYFLGSSYGWLSYDNAGADNLIPMELALKIASKIRAGERFAVYIVIPMWPEGVPTSNYVQEILYWQGQTMKMMYSIIGEELKSTNNDKAHPQEYLNFYCLGKRELPNHTIHSTTQVSNEVSSEKYRRFMIYVHAKGMVVDDEYVILGSANINQRSLDGSRDTEIAMGAYQPYYTWESKRIHPQGQIYGYRMSLWAEHLGGVDPLFKEPHSLDCVKYVNKLAEENWSRYNAEDIIPLKGHLLMYPISVDADGKVEPLPGKETFPDVGGKVLGEPTTPLPDELTM